MQSVNESTLGTGLRVRRHRGTRQNASCIGGFTTGSRGIAFPALFRFNIRFAKKPLELPCLLARASIRLSRLSRSLSQSALCAAELSESPTIVLAPVRANVALTTNALLGFVNSQPVFLQDMIRPIDKDLRALAAHSKNITDFRDSARTVISRQMQAYVYEMVMMSAARSDLSDQDKSRLDIYMRIQAQRVDLTLWRLPRTR